MTLQELQKQVLQLPMSDRSLVISTNCIGINTTRNYITIKEG
jgi:hypothetical protein